MVLPNRESLNDGTFDASRLLEKVFERNNMLIALKRVTINKGTYGVGGMKTYELSEHSKKHWATIKAKVLKNTICIVGEIASNSDRMYTNCTLQCQPF